MLLFSMKGGSRSVEVQQAIAALHLSALEEGCMFVGLQYIPSALHQPADELSRLREPPGWALRASAFRGWLRHLEARSAPIPSMDALASRQRALLRKFCSAWIDPDASCSGFGSQNFPGEILWINTAFSRLHRVERHLIAIGAVGYALLPADPRWRPPYLGRFSGSHEFLSTDFEFLGTESPKTPAPAAVVVAFDFRRF